MLEQITMKLPVGRKQAVEHDPNDPNRLGNVAKRRVSLLQTSQFGPQQISHFGGGLWAFNDCSVICRGLKPRKQVADGSPGCSINRAS
jgi:hypothetical protein